MTTTLNPRELARLWRLRAELDDHALDVAESLVDEAVARGDERLLDVAQQLIDAVCDRGEIERDYEELDAILTQWQARRAGSAAGKLAPNPRLDAVVGRLTTRWLPERRPALTLVGGGRDDG